MFLLLLLASCGSVRPTAQLGLLAPFEGLHRRSGYAALERVRAVVTALPVAPVGWMPLALDSSRDPARAAQKLGANRQVAAIVGPLHPADGFAVAAVPHGERPWLAPYAVAAGGFVEPGTGDWVDAMVEAAAADAAASGAARLVIGGWSDAFPPVAAPAREGFAPIPAISVASPDALDPGDALLWLGSAADGARFLRQARARLTDLPVWLGAWLAADPVFLELMQAGAPADWSNLVAIGWVTDSYATWSAENPGASFYHFQLDRCARAALAQAGAAIQDPSVGAEWRAAFFQPFPSPAGVEWRLRL